MLDYKLLIGYAYQLNFDNGQDFMEFYITLERLLMIRKSR